MLLGYGAKVGLGNMRVKAENRMVTNYPVVSALQYSTPLTTKSRIMRFLTFVIPVFLSDGFGATTTLTRFGPMHFKKMVQSILLK